MLPDPDMTQFLQNFRTNKTRFFTGLPNRQPTKPLRPTVTSESLWGRLRSAYSKATRSGLRSWFRPSCGRRCRCGWTVAALLQHRGRRAQAVPTSLAMRSNGGEGARKGMMIAIDAGLGFDFRHSWKLRRRKIIGIRPRIHSPGHSLLSLESSSVFIVLRIF